MTQATTSRIDWASTLPHRTKLLILSATLLCLFLAALDQTIVATALPAIVAQFHGIDLLSWVSIGYLVSSTAMVPIYGRLSDLYGRRSVLLFGLVVFLIGSALCGLAGGMLSLIWYRVLQGVGAAAITSTAFAVPADLFPPSERSRYMGLLGASFGLASVVGPFLGGLLTDHMNWRWIFYVNLPLGAVAMAFILTKMPKLRSGAEQHPIDIAGTVLLVLTVVPLMLGLSFDPHRTFRGLPLNPLLFAVSAVAALGFALVERRAKAPVIPFELFRNRTFASVTIASFLFGAAFMAAVLFLAIFMVNVVGVSATDAGTALIPLIMGVVFGGILASQYTHRTGRYKTLIVAGAVLMAIGLWLGSRMHAGTTRWDVMWRMLVIGLGAGPAMPLLSVAMQNAVPMDKVGAATAGRQFFAQMGQALGAALFGMVLSTTLTTALEARLTPVLAELPLAVRSRFDPAQFRNSATGRDAGAADSPSIAERVAAGIREDGARRRVLAEAADAPPLAAVEAAEQARGREIATAITLAVRSAFAVAIARVYFGAMFIALALIALIALTLPELPLRTSNTAEAFEALEPKR